MEELTLNARRFAVLRLLGRGKGGYSYLVTDGAGEYVLKQIHHEPCAYYRFGDKLAAELRDYERLHALALPMPELLEVDFAQERLLKEYIEGETVFELVQSDALPPEYLVQMRELSARVSAAGLNIDYFPTNFVARDGRLFYIDYECNAYTDEWNFENWEILVENEEIYGIPGANQIRRSALQPQRTSSLSRIISYGTGGRTFFPGRRRPESRSDRSRFP